MVSQQAVVVLGTWHLALSMDVEVKRWINSRFVFQARMSLRVQSVQRISGHDGFLHASLGRRRSDTPPFIGNLDDLALSSSPILLCGAQEEKTAWVDFRTRSLRGSS